MQNPVFEPPRLSSSLLNPPFCDNHQSVNNRDKRCKSTMTALKHTLIKLVVLAKLYAESAVNSHFIYKHARRSCATIQGEKQPSKQKQKLGRGKRENDKCFL